jgi:hypothetical protein
LVGFSLNHNAHAGINVISSISFVPPIFDFQGPATAVFHPSNCSNAAHQTFALPVEYFEYPPPKLVLVSPASGPVAGNNAVGFVIEEAVGVETRAGAALPNFLAATSESLQVQQAHIRHYDFRRMQSIWLQSPVLLP